MKKRCFQLLVLAILLSPICHAQAQPPVTKGNYHLASKFSPKKLSKLIFSTAVDPHWLKHSDRFWYVYETTEGKKWYIVDPAKKSKKELFDNEKMAAAITRIVRDPFDAQHLEIENLEFIKEDKFLRFEVRSTLEVEKKKTDSASTSKDSTRRDGGRRGAMAQQSQKEKKVFYLEYNLQTGELKELVDYEKPKSRPVWANIAPDSSCVVFAREYNLYWMDKENFYKAMKNEDDSTIVEHRLTSNGIEDFGYGRGYSSSNDESEKEKKKRRGVYVIWSPDSKHFVTTLTDTRKVKSLWVINSLAEPRPTLESYKYHMPGEKDAPVEHLVLVNPKAGKVKELRVNRFKDQTLGVWTAPKLSKERDDDFKPAIWLGTNSRFYLHRTSRDLKSIDVCVADVDGDSIRPVIEERMNTYLELRLPGLVANGKEIIHWSERDGWAHFYLYDENGNLKNQITSGSFHCEEIVKIDEKNRVLYFTANGREPNEDPYYLHLYRVNFDGSGLKLLNAGNFDHAISMNDSYTYFVNNKSRVNTVPVSELYDNNGKKVMELEKADLSQLFAAGYKFPETFKVKADDGITDLYGVMYKPFDFDSTKKYPIIEYVYPGPQTEAVNKAFGRSMDRIDRLAQFGFIVVTVGNRGGHPARSKWYHNYGYGNLRDYGLADKKATVEQLAARHPFIDIDRVGITGHSGGGFMSTAAMLVYPDFFKVAVSGAGNHENNIYNRWWSEKHHGVKEVISATGDTTFQYAIDKNSELAKNLKGKLLLVTGDIDNNVHPGNTIRMANALIRANKRFDFMIMPGQRHAFGDMTEYFFWMMGDYFCKHLLGDFSQPVDVTEINREIEQTNKRR